MNKRIIECVPNFSEGRDKLILDQIAQAIVSVDGVTLLDMDPGMATNRTVFTFVGEPEPVIEAAFKAIQKAAELIDMSRHQGAHPRMGATDVCPLVPVSGITMEEVVLYARQLAERVGRELGIPVYCYEEAAFSDIRKNLATIRAGEYEALPEKLLKPEWKPDFGPALFNKRSGATVIGARDFLIAYNVNLNTTSVRRANSVAFDVREQGRVLREGHPVTGKIAVDADGNPIRIPGVCPGVKGIGWYIEEYGIAQVSMNITDTRKSALHDVFEACCTSASNRGMRVTGSELVGLVPLQVMLDAGRYFLQKQERSTGVSDKELIHIAVKSMGLDELSAFDPDKKIIEYQLRKKEDERLINMSLHAFVDETASESPAPGGGSVAAMVGSLGAALNAMVANLSAAKRGWEPQYAFFSAQAEAAQAIKKELLFLVDEDTRAFNAIMEAFALPKNDDKEKAQRKTAIQQATLHAIEVPFRVLEVAASIMEIAELMTQKGSPNSLSDAAVGALCARTAVYGAYLNVCINASSLDDKALVEQYLEKSKVLLEDTIAKEKAILQYTLNSLLPPKT
jgi:glutamate formiminotransferase / formiminotetrahydrofolate cyclodeaminase